ncbi:MAG TPA: hypothetical protein H9867_00550 [Candidatus Corynebacterium gallistercoris]|uniref:Uncharacterized protein n=1 Tax=Candidatus Corynebacterium gallistercoris TaxID=2838530 RepID=A0A9D1RWS7_9CORY|nr:hypothetical protein [Candidatus Corynebacterium gallistercoris]
MARFLAFVNFCALVSVVVGFFISRSVAGTIESNAQWEQFLWWPLAWWQTVLVDGGWFAVVLTPLVLAVLKNVRRSFRLCVTITGMALILSVVSSALESVFVLYADVLLVGFAIATLHFGVMRFVGAARLGG